MVGLAQTGQMPTDATQRCVYDIAATTPIKCGRGLPPIAVDQLAPRLADTPQSGASPLPQGLDDDGARVAAAGNARDRVHTPSAAWAVASQGWRVANVGGGLPPPTGVRR